MYKIFGDSGFDIGFIVMIGSFTLLWILSIILTNVSIVDIAWGIGYTGNVLIFFFCHDWHWANLLVMIVVGLHGLRLGLYILVRNCGHGEDKRYQAFRAKFGGDTHYWWVSFFQVFMLQFILNFGLCSTFGLFMLETSKDIVNDHNSVELKEPNVPLVIIGAVIANFGTWYQSIADFHLCWFKSNPENKGKLLTTGVWSHCRHPNYWGETVFWWGTYLFSCAVGQYWAIYSPILLTLLIIFVSGVSLLESGMKNNKYGEEYDDYLKNTAKFIPFIW